ncbi:MAG TPA: MFS transporter [Frankiaceae bacterium]|nr:MFS transporter [Frankiaceae bacterium]
MTEPRDDDVVLEATGIDEPERSGRWLRRARGLAIDVTPLRTSPGYRRLFLGDAVSTIGTQMTSVAVPLQVYDITGSSLAVGMLGIASLVPLVVFGLIGGAIADAMDRRRLLVISTTLLALVTGVLFLQAAFDLRQVWLLYVLTFFQSALFAVDHPARRAVIPRLLAAHQIPAATALSQVLFNFAMVLGPLAAGVLVGQLGYAWVYGIDAVSFVAAVVAVVGLPAVPPIGGGTAAGLGSVLEGLRFLRTQPVVLMTFAVDINAMVFGMPRALFPALAEGRFGGGPSSAGLLYATPAVGALAGALLGGWFGRVRRQGLAVLIAVAAWGLSIVGFGLATAMWVAVLMLACAGAADMVSAVFRNSILQVATPDALRGRLNGVFIAVVAGGPRLGDVEAGAVAAATSVQFSVVSGGFACILGVVALAALVPAFARYTAPPEELPAPPDPG